MTIAIRRYAPTDKSHVVALSLRAWASVFEQFEPAVPDYVYKAFYPDGWAERQAADVATILDSEDTEITVATRGETIVGWVGIRLHPADHMGEIHILAVDPAHQRRGVATALLNDAFARIRAAGMAMVMVETGDDPGHLPSRSTYERAGFERWPVARYFRKL